MEFQLTSPETPDEDPVSPPVLDAGSSFQISPQPIVSRVSAETEETGAPQLPRSYGTEALSLLARDPHTVFAFWDIDWNTALKDLQPKARKVHLRLLNARGREEKVLEIEPMAGSCYIHLAEADASYTGEIGFYNPAGAWHCLATSALVSTPADTYSAESEIDFATVPFHLSFQRMVDLLQTTQQENAHLTTMLADLRARVSSGEPTAPVTPEQRELARTIEHVASIAPPSTPAADPRRQRKLERILGTGPSVTSPAGGFGGNSSRSA